MWDKLKEQFNIYKIEKKSVYWIVNVEAYNSEDVLLDTVANVLQYGVDVVELRNKALPDNKIAEISKKIKLLCSEYNATFIIYGRVDIALIAEADGVLLNESHLNIEHAKTLLPKTSIIGREVSSSEEVIGAINWGADYIIYNSVSPKKIDREGIVWVQENISTPVFISGVITDDNINKIISLNVSRIALHDNIRNKEDMFEQIVKIRQYLPI